MAISAADHGLMCCVGHCTVVMYRGVNVMGRPSGGKSGGRESSQEYPTALEHEKLTRHEASRKTSILGVCRKGWPMLLELASSGAGQVAGQLPRFHTSYTQLYRCSTAQTLSCTDTQLYRYSTMISVLPDRKPMSIAPPTGTELEQMCATHGATNNGGDEVNPTFLAGDTTPVTLGSAFNTVDAARVSAMDSDLLTHR